MDTIHIPDAHIRKYEGGYISQGVNKKQMAHPNQDSQGELIYNSVDDVREA